MSNLLASSLKTARFDRKDWQDCCEGPVSSDGKNVNWLTIQDQAESVTEDVVRIQSQPLVPADIPVYGYIDDVKSGRLFEVPAATETGRPG